MATVASDLVGPADAECLHSQELTAAWRWSVLIGGAVVLGLGPAAPAMLERALSPRVPGEWALALYQGFAVASEVVPSLVLGIVAALSWRPAWQRVLVLAPAFAVQLVSYVLFWCRGAQSNRAWGALLLFPLVIMAAASPAFLLRLWRQWTLVPEANRVRPRPASIISLMLAMACWAGAAACTQWVSGDGGGLWVEPKLEDAPGLDTLAKLVAAVVFLLIPGAFIGLSLVL